MKRKIVEIKDDKNTRFCRRCGLLETEVRKNGSGGCGVGYGGFYKNHWYITDSEIAKRIQEGK